MGLFLINPAQAFPSVGKFLCPRIFRHGKSLQFRQIVLIFASMIRFFRRGFLCWGPVVASLQAALMQFDDLGYARQPESRRVYVSRNKPGFMLHLLCSVWCLLYTPKERENGLIKNRVNQVGVSNKRAEVVEPLPQSKCPPAYIWGVFINSPVWPGLVWFITGPGKCHYVCVVGTAPLQVTVCVVGTAPLQKSPRQPVAHMPWQYLDT